LADQDAGQPGSDDLDPLRAMCVAAWAAQDDGASGVPPAPDGNMPPWVVEAADDAARGVVTALQLQ
jgi:hypothetical protein